MCFLYYTKKLDEMSIRETLILGVQKPDLFFGVTDDVKRYTKNASLWTREDTALAATDSKRISG